MARPDNAPPERPGTATIAPAPLGEQRRPAAQTSQSQRSPARRLPAWLASPWLSVALVCVAAAFFRLWQISALPPGLFGDEATDGLDALDVLAGRGAVFFPANFGREGLHMWLVAGSFRLLGINALALRLPSVIAGILTALATLWLGVELAHAFGGRSRQVDGRSPVGFPAIAFGLLAALYLSTSYFNVHFSRFGIRGVFTPLCAALAFAAFWRGVNVANGREQQATGLASRACSQPPPGAENDPPRGRARDHRSGLRMSPKTSPGQPHLWFALSGLFLGLGTHFYTASRFMPIFLGGFLVVQALVAYATRRREQAILIRHFWPVVLLFVVAALVFAPLGLYFLQHPGSFSQRASEVSAFKAGSPWARMGQAALANVLQFFLPGRGDQAQFYNLPGRPIFDPLTAVLAVIGIGALIYRIRQPAALFLLLWWPALLLPSFLATDRYPTLPRVLGTIPGVYFFPAAGVLGLMTLWQGWRTRGSLGASPGADPSPPRYGGRGSESPNREATVRFQIPPTADVRPPRDRVRDHRFGLRMGRKTRPGHGASREAAVALAGLAGLALLVHAGFTYRDYFLVWGRSAATYEAFEEDMAQAAGWLAANQPSGHVYLSSDIYRHPTFMLLYEHATVTRYFADTDTNLSWFDARSALPLPPPGEPAVYLLGDSALPAPSAVAYLPGESIATRAGRAAPPMLAVANRPGDAPQPAPDRPPEAFSDRLALIGASWLARPDAAPALQLYWRTAGPDPAGWPGYRLQIAGEGWQIEVPFDDFRAPEWVPSGSFLTWREVKLPDGTTQLPSTVRLRLVSAGNGEALTTPDAPDGWHVVGIGG